MSDSQSYPLQVKSYPKLWDAAYSDVERYIQEDVADIVEYARLRGVRVMVEFDMPVSVHRDWRRNRRRGVHPVGVHA